jgi:hypothetical protein
MGFGGTRPRNCMITYDTYKFNAAEKAKKFSTKRSTSKSVKRHSKSLYEHES